jgi:hypothetical protein
MNTDVLNGPLADAGAKTLDQLTGVGVGFTIMLLVTVFSVFVSAYLLNQLISLIKEGIKSNTALEGAIRDALKRED